jgi:hypothetical protein
MNKFRMKQNVLQVVIPLIMVLLILPGDVMAKRAAQLSIEKTDSEIIEGQLIHVDVKEKSLVIFSGSDGIRIYMDEVDTIRIKWKSSVAKGFLVGAGIGATLGLVLTDPQETMIPRKWVAASFGLIFGLLGMFDVAVKPKYKEIRVKGKSPGEVRKILKKLEKKALK